ncbi:MAG TPA: DUF2238 domain-containing protein [Deltaproteobacteria bacterium]|nr:DUF2238 domain-containing protein [Deltaproteobacteria bacterium]
MWVTVCGFLFFVIHEIGPHHTYAEVPCDAWFEFLTGTRLLRKVLNILDD